MNEKIKIRYLFIAVVTIGLFVIASLHVGQTSSVIAAQPQPQFDNGVMRTVSVSGRGEVEVDPDFAIVQVGVQTQADTAGDAVNQNNQQIQSVIDALSEAGVASNDIETQTIQLNPIFDEGPRPAQGQREVTGFRAVNIVQVTVREIGNLGEILDAAVNAGANLIQSIEFQISDPQDALDTARERAVNDAQHKAEQLAALTGTTLGPVLTINETGQTLPPFGRGGGAPVAEAAAVPVQPGTQTVEVNVQITWMLQGGEDSQPSVVIFPTSGEPGTEVQVQASGFPANTMVNIGVGRWRSEYDVAKSVQTGPNGTVETQVSIPDFAETGERWVVVVAVPDGGVDATSNIFNVSG